MHVPKIQAQVNIGKSTATPLAYIKLATELYKAGKATSSYLAPSEVEQASAKQAERDIQFLNSLKELRGCLIKNRNNAQLNEFGVPIACEQVAILIQALGGEAELERWLEILNKYKNKEIN